MNVDQLFSFSKIAYIDGVKKKQVVIQQMIFMKPHFLILSSGFIIMVLVLEY